MMDLKDILAYIIRNYPHKKELSKARLTKMVYLADWNFAKMHNKQITRIDWYFDNYGPFVWDVIDCVKSNPSLFEINNEINNYGSDKSIISMKNSFYESKLPIEVKTILNEVIEETKRLYWKDFIDFVYSTYPIVISKKYSRLDLITLAKEYKSLRNGI